MKISNIIGVLVIILSFSNLLVIHVIQNLFSIISEIGDVKASIAALTFILSSAAKYNCDGETVSNELQQLGLPKGWERERERELKHY